MTNPNNTVRVRARNGGRASVYEANGWAQGFTGGLFEGTGVIQNTVADMNVLVGGSATNPDVVLAENPSGYKIALDLVSQQAVAITAPASNSRISAIVAYTDDLSLATTQDTVTGSPASCGLIVVNGTTANNPVEPTDAQIRTAITADGATGSQAAYCVIAYILVASNTTAIDNSLIAINKAYLKTQNIDFNSFFNSFSQDPTLSKGYYKLGNLLFCWGSTELTIGTAAYSEASESFTFAQPFASTPIVMLSNGDLSGACGEYNTLNRVSTTQCSVFVGHTGVSEDNKIKVSYLAIGTAAS